MVGGMPRGKIVLYMPSCVAGGEWNHVSAPSGTAADDVGEGERDFMRVLARRFFTASESDESSSSDEDSEPDSESSSPDNPVS